MGRVCVIGYLSIDRIRRGDTASGDLPGGAALYAALGARAAGADVSLHACAGDDYARAWLDDAARLGIDVAPVRYRPGPTRRARRVHDATGHRESPHHAERLWWERTAALAPTPPTRIDADMLVLTAMHSALLATVLDHATGTRTVADTSEAFARTESRALLAQVARLHVFAPSREETRHLLPAVDDDAAALELAARVCRVLQKRGADGALAIEDGRPTPLAAPPANVVDPTGAGDATIGALAAHLAAGLAFLDAARAALRIGARTVAGIGPSALGLATGAR